jgi:hypothetical protein
MNGTTQKGNNGNWTGCEKPLELQELINDLKKSEK